MFTTEALRTQLDPLRLQLYALETENKKLRDVHLRTSGDNGHGGRVATDSKGKRASRSMDQLSQPRSISGDKRTSVRDALARQLGLANAIETRATRGGDSDVR